MSVQIQGSGGFDQLVPRLEYFVERACLPTWKIPRHRLDYHDLTWVVSGRADYRCDDRIVEARAGDLLYLPRGAIREAVTDRADPMHCFACNFLLVPVDGVPLPAALPFPLRTPIGEPEGLRDLYRRLNRVWLEQGPGYTMEAQGWMTLILHRLFLATGTSPETGAASPRLAWIQGYLVQHYDEPLRVDHLAALVRLHPGYLGSWFRRQTGLTLHQYVNRIRVRKAIDLLSTGGYNVGETAEQCGFNDVFHFSKVFRGVTGYPPSNLLRSTEGPR